LEEVTILLASVIAARSPDEVEQLAQDPRYYCLPDRQTVLCAAPEIQRKLMRVDKLLVQAGLADSTSDASRKLKQNSVRINSKPVTESNLMTILPVSDFLLRLGRKIKKVKIDATGV
jgi:tyrosyl-tRNA synthetase